MYEDRFFFFLSKKNHLSLIQLIEGTTITYYNILNDYAASTTLWYLK